jgi:hypothetical protein
LGLEGILFFVAQMEGLFTYQPVLIRASLTKSSIFRSYNLI